MRDSRLDGVFGDGCGVAARIVASSCLRVALSDWRSVIVEVSSLTSCW